jgi:predicted transcriptional regulator
MMNKRVKVNVGTLDEMGQRFVNAWHRLEHGEKVRERHVTFPDLSVMLNALSPKRLELLRAVHETPAPSVKALAERLGRDYKRVHEAAGDGNRKYRSGSETHLNSRCYETDRALRAILV